MNSARNAPMHATIAYWSNVSFMTVVLVDVLQWLLSVLWQSFVFAQSQASNVDARLVLLVVVTTCLVSIVGNGRQQGWAWRSYSSPCAILLDNVKRKGVENIPESGAYDLVVVHTHWLVHQSITQGRLRVPCQLVGKLQEPVVPWVACWHPHEVVWHNACLQVNSLVRESDAVVLDRGWGWSKTCHGVFGAGDGLTGVA